MERSIRDIDMEAVKEKQWQGVSGSTLKLLAIVTMLIDHIAATVLARMLQAEADYELYTVYYAMRQIGRIAFPIYCFMLVEGLKYTHNRWRYAARLGIFALLSEIPFDLAFSSEVLEFGYQNVFFTLTIGLVTLIVIEEIAKRQCGPDNKGLPTAAGLALTVLASAAGMGLAALLQTDYGWRGVACILILYFFRGRRGLALVMGYVAFVLFLGEIAALPAFLVLALYRGKKGFSCKYFFYGFYPLHLLLLYLTCVLMGIAGYSAI